MCEITIIINEQTAQTIANDGFSLCAWKVVKTTAGGAQPLVWYTTTGIALNTTLGWLPQYTAYVSLGGSTFTAQSQAPINIGQIAQVEQSGQLNVVGGGPAGAMSILNQTTTQYTCGLASQLPNVPLSPIVAMPLFGNMFNAITPVEQVLLSFTTQPLQAGQVVSVSYGQGFLIDMTESNQRSVNFDINLGWTNGGLSWGTVIPADTPLGPLLVLAPPPSLAEEVAKRSWGDRGGGRVREQET